MGKNNNKKVAERLTTMGETRYNETKGILYQ
jgi:hypothetical protein